MTMDSDDYARESWRMFRIMSEFVMGFDVLAFESGLALICLPEWFLKAPSWPRSPEPLLVVKPVLCDRPWPVMRGLPVLCR